MDINYVTLFFGIMLGHDILSFLLLSIYARKSDRDITMSFTRFFTILFLIQYTSTVDISPDDSLERRVARMPRLHGYQFHIEKIIKIRESFSNGL